MPSEHYITGKDASLEASIERMQKQLATIGFHVEERSWLNPIEGIWSVHVSDRDCPLLFTNGKGASKLAALASALGEFFERLSTNYFWSHYYLGESYAALMYTHHPLERWFKFGADGAWPTGLLTPELQSFYNPDGRVSARMLVDLNSGNERRGICALPFARLGDGARVWFPVNIIGNLYVSNGMSAGNSASEARTQALSEIIERYVKFRVIGEGLCLPDVPDAVIARHPSLAADIAALRAAGFGILVKDASLGGQYPVLNVTLLNPVDQGCFSSFGAHPCFAVALERALTELLQGRALDGLLGFPEPGFDLDEIASPPNLEIHFVDSSGIISWDFLGDTPDYAFCDWNFAGTTQQDCAYLIDILHAQGHEIYVADYSHLGVYACRIVVPGVSEIYPIDDLEYENNSFGNVVRQNILNLPELADEECGALLETLNDASIADDRPVAALIGIAADPGSLWDELRVGELKTLLALAIGDEDATREGCDWIRHFAQLDAQRRLVYRCIETLLTLRDGGDDASYRASLASLYGRSALDQADALLKRHQRFFGVQAPGKTLRGLAMHQRLLDAYGKVHRRHVTTK